jgi:sRNA-binding carbon storage regulator CsrA
MLIITRKRGQSIRIAPGPDTDPATPIGDIFARGPIEVLFVQARGSQIRLGIIAPLSLVVLRDELVVAPLT